MSNHRVSTWTGLVRVLRKYDPRTVVRLEKGVLPHPRVAGMALSIGLPEGQRSDYRLLLSDGAGLHVKDFGTHYEAHLDEVHPGVSVSEHLRRDAPGVYVASGAALGAFVGRAMGATRDATLVGALFGGLLAAMATAKDEE